MSDIETADMHPRTLDKGQLAIDSESAEDLPPLPSHLTLRVSATY